MYVIDACDVTDALYQGLTLLQRGGHTRDSRNGQVVQMDCPVTTLYRQPRLRVLTWPARDANPFFHLYESLWMLGGRNDVAPLAWHVARMADYSDDGERFHGAYGARWRGHFGVDQLASIIASLRRDPNCRRQVLQVWDSGCDLGVGGRDLPCNTEAYVWRNRHGLLDMTVLCRSNDIIWGAYGANAVQWTILQEYIAAGLGCQVGQHWRLSNNFHAYLEPYNRLMSCTREPSPYALSAVRPAQLVSNFVRWNDELVLYLEWADEVMGGPNRRQPDRLFREPFFDGVAGPMMMAYAARKRGDFAQASHWCSRIMASDWRLAASEWIQRRAERRTQSGADYKRQGAGGA